MTNSAGPEPSVVSLARSALNQGREALAANDLVSALRWLERAHRLVPEDPNATLALASACLANDPARAAALFLTITHRHDVQQAWFCLAAARLRLDEPDAASDALAVALSRHAFTPNMSALADAIGLRPGGNRLEPPGWCALTSDGRVQVRPATPGKVRILLDGKPIRGPALPAAWPSARLLEVKVGDCPLLGSPIQIAAIRRLAGCVEVHDGGLRGWAWHPGDPHTPPALTLVFPAGHPNQTIVLSDETKVVPETGPLARPRSFRLARAQLPDVNGPIRVLGPDGNDLTGSPVNPWAEEAALVAAASRVADDYPARPRSPRHPATTGWAALPADGPVPARPVGADNRRRSAIVVIPVHDGGAVVLACLASVLASVPPGTRILVVDDGSTDPVLITALEDLARCRKLSLLRHPRALGFPASANAGVQAGDGRDVVLLNSDTLVPPGWLDRLRAAAYAARNIGTVTPLSNDASILSYPGEAGANPRPDQGAVNRLDRLAARANGTATVGIPVGVGFCMYLRRDCLNAVGLLRADVFAQGYGEENDFSLRAQRLGWRNVAVTGLFVGHHSGTSFTSSGVHLRARNRRIIERLHPGYDALITRFVAADPLAAPRRRIDLLVWRARARNWPTAAILITHNDGGGVEQRLAASAEGHTRAGRRPIILRPAKTAAGEPAIAVRDAAADDLPNLVFAMPAELSALVRLLRAAGPEIIEAHHLAFYPPAIYQVIAQLGVPYEVHVHDYAWFCPRISLVNGHDHYCGEPDLADCEACIVDHGHFMEENIGVESLRSRSATFLSSARRVIVPSDDAGSRMRRHFDLLATETVRHEDDTAIDRGDTPGTRGSDRPIVCVVGAIGVHKGYDILLACARDADRRDLDLEFVVVGHTIDDARMMATGRVFITGQFKPSEAVTLIAAQHASLGFVASIAPETWCLGLGDIWRAGLAAAAFDIGAPAERIRATGRGFLLPLGLSAGAINNTFLAAIRSAARR